MLRRGEEQDVEEGSKPGWLEGLSVRTRRRGREVRSVPAFRGWAGGMSRLPGSAEQASGPAPVVGNLGGA